MRLAIGSVSRAAEDVHTALHIVVDTETFQMKHVTCASKWVAQELVKKALRHEKKVGRQFPRVGARLLLSF